MVAANCDSAVLIDNLGTHTDGLSEAEDPLTCVARGGGRALEMMDKHTMDLLSSE